MGDDGEGMVCKQCGEISRPLASYLIFHELVVEMVRVPVQKPTTTRWWRWRVSSPKLVLLLLNIASTGLTLFSGLHENAMIVTLTGRYNRIRARLLDGSINMSIARDDEVALDLLPPHKEVAENFRFIAAPRQEPRTIGSDGSICLSVNSINTSVVSVMYDDFWGKGSRRVQIFYHSISAPHCQVINFKKGWRKKCIDDRGGNVTACDEYVLRQFDALLYDRRIQAEGEGDFGVKGTPFLKCLRRPNRVFQFQTDQITHENYWDGQPYHLAIQTSDCLAHPRVRSDDLEWGLFEVEAVDQGCDVLFALPNPGWFATIVSFLYSLVSVAIIGLGLTAAIVRSRRVTYLPDERRYAKEHRLLRYLVPFMPMATLVTENQTSIIHFKGELIVASDFWINHWLYMLLSILDALCNIRLIYVDLQVGTWYLVLKITFENFMFLCSGLAKMSWLTCLVHTMVKLLLKAIARGLKSIKLIKGSQRKHFNHWLDGMSLFMNYKLYNLILCAYLAILLQALGSPTFMVRQIPYLVGNFGGIPKIGTVWNSELVCDYVTLMALQIGTGFVVGTAFMFTKYKHLARNSIINLLQRRYMVVGWDVLLAADLLGMNVHEPDFFVDGVARTKCSVGVILQLLYLSGPSSMVHLAGDPLFVGGFSKAPPLFRYTVRKAIEVGLVRGRGGDHTLYSVASAHYDTSIVATQPRDHHDKHESTSYTHSVHTHPTSSHAHQQPVASIFERRLVVLSEGYFWKILLIDQDLPPLLTKNNDTGLMEYEVQDALTRATILDIKPILTGDKKLRIR